MSVLGNVLVDSSASQWDFNRRLHVVGVCWNRRCANRSIPHVLLEQDADTVWIISIECVLGVCKGAES